jgi:hypothetical protein
MARLPSPADPRRADAEDRLRRAKAAIAAACAATAVAVWGLVAGSVAASTAPVTAPTTTNVIRRGDDGAFFGTGSSLPNAVGQAPILRSHGS